MYEYWNPWHGCHKISPGCKYCYVYRTDSRYEKDSSEVRKNNDFDLPIRKKRDGSYKIESGAIVYTCFTSDFFVEDADPFRAEAWNMICKREDLHFIIFTKRIDRFLRELPKDWGEGYSNVTIGCTVEDQTRATERLPIFMRLPIAHKMIICAPLLERLNLTPWLDDSIGLVSAGGESGTEARVCDFDWLLDLRNQCMEADVAFSFHQTGAYFKKDGRIYRIKRKYQHSQAKKAGINYLPARFKGRTFPI